MESNIKEFRLKLAVNMLKKILLTFTLGCFIALVSIINGVQCLSIVIALGYVYYCFEKTNKAFWITYFIAIVLPISQNKIIDYLSINIAGKSINIIDFMAVTLFLVVLIKSIVFRQFSRKNKVNSIFFIYVTLCIFYACVGYMSGNDALNDFKMYIIQMIMFYCYYKVGQTNEDIYKLMNNTLIAITINSIWTIFMYMTNKWSIWGIEYYGGRFGGNYLTLFIITINYAFFLYYNKQYKICKLVLITSIVLSFILMLLSQNRTNPILCLVGIIMMFTFAFKNKKSNRKMISKISMLSLIILVSTLTLSMLFTSDNEFISRYKQMDVIKDDQNVQTRINTINYHIDFIFDKPLGSGFGTTMAFVDSNNALQFEDSLNIDNSYINIARKCGVITLIIYILLIISPLLSLYKLYKIKKDKIYLCLLISYFMLLCGSSLMTAHSIKSYAVSIFIWVFISFTNLELNNNKINDSNIN